MAHHVCRVSPRPRLQALPACLATAAFSRRHLHLHLWAPRQFALPRIQWWAGAVPSEMAPFLSRPNLLLFPKHHVVSFLILTIASILYFVCVGLLDSELTQGRSILLSSAAGRTHCKGSPKRWSVGEFNQGWPLSFREHQFPWDHGWGRQEAEQVNMGRSTCIWFRWWFSALEFILKISILPVKSVRLNLTSRNIKERSW